MRHNAQAGRKIRKESIFKERFEKQRSEFNRSIQNGNNRVFKHDDAQGQREMYKVPVVFHIVLANPENVTDLQVQAQLDTLNRDYFGNNGDSTRIPSYFKPFFGKSGIQFCLAQRTPDGDATTGIERTVTSRSSFSNSDDGVKHATSGGADCWDPDRYFNVWLCVLSNNVLGYATFPDDGSPDEQGVAIDHRCLPGGSFSNYNTGKTLVHEAGHYFNLYHIWGDDNGACTGTDYVDDTPNQANYSSGCYSGIRTDNCTASGNGIMYQDYMDYSNDACLVMFTGQQTTRMESALLEYRSSLLASDGCSPPVPTDYNSALVSIDQPAQRICDRTVSPVVTIKNKGNRTLNSLMITSETDGNISTYSWSGTLAKSASATVALKSLTVATGRHTLVIYTSMPNNNADEDASNDTLSTTFQYHGSVGNISEGFENREFPPIGWDIVNPDKKNTWVRTMDAAKTGNASIMIDNYDNSRTGAKDDIRLPVTNIAGVDSAYITFEVAAATFTNASTQNNVWDTLEVLASSDCGKSYNSLYKKWGGSLVTRPSTVTTAFTPTASEWRKDSVNISSYVGAGDMLYTFRNTNGNENNIYLDDINIKTVTINPNLKEQAFLVTPNPTSGQLSVQFYPNPVNLKGIEVFNILGQKVAVLTVTNPSTTVYHLDMSAYAAGIYFVKAVFGDRIAMKKILKK